MSLPRAVHHRQEPDSSTLSGKPDVALNALFQAWDHLLVFPINHLQPVNNSDNCQVSRKLLRLSTLSTINPRKLLRMEELCLTILLVVIQPRRILARRRASNCPTRLSSQLLLRALKCR